MLSEETISFYTCKIFTRYDSLYIPEFHGLFLLCYKFDENIIHPRHKFLE